MHSRNAAEPSATPGRWRLWSSLLFASAAFAAALTRSVLIYFQDKAAALRELHRVLAPGGHLSAWGPINRAAEDYGVEEFADSAVVGAEYERVRTYQNERCEAREAMVAFGRRVPALRSGSTVTCSRHVNETFDAALGHGVLSDGHKEMIRESNAKAPRDNDGAVGDDGGTRRDEEDVDGLLIGGREQRVIEIVAHRAEWGKRFEQEKARIEAALGGAARRIEHVGSTAVPGLAGKPVVDVMVTVEDPADEPSYLPALTGAGYLLRVREPGHRMLRTPELDVHVHVWRAGSEDERRHLVFRDRLRLSAADRAEYEQTKREMARQFRDMNAYADAKSDVIETIVRRAGTGVAPSSSLRWLERIPTGRAWLASLPALVDECCRRWSLTHGSPYPGSSVSLVIPVWDRRGREAVLKLQYPDAESEHEAAALAAWGGSGAVVLLDRAPEMHALLIERCVPGTPLSHAGPEEALEVLIGLLPRLAVPAPPVVKSLEDEARRWAANLAPNWEKAGRPFDVALLDIALELLATLPSSQGAQVLVHQDLHAGNVLRAQREPWLAIDPKPLTGEIAFAVAPIVRGSELGLGREAMIHRLDRLVDGLGLDRERARGWAIVQTLAWAFEDMTVLRGHIETAIWLVAA